jgi:hypothetical protein
MSERDEDRRGPVAPGGGIEPGRGQPSPGKQTRTQGLSRRHERPAAPAAAAPVGPTVWPRPRGCPPHVPYGVTALPTCETGRLREIVSFVLRQAGAPDIWPGWTHALARADASVWSDHVRAGQGMDEIHPDAAMPAATLTITAALASCEPVPALEPTYHADLVFEVRAVLPNYRAGAPEAASVETIGGESSALRTAVQTLRTGSITFTLATGMVEHDHAIDRTSPLEWDPSGRDQSDDLGQRATSIAPPPPPAPPSVSDLLAVATNPVDANAEFTGLRTEIETGLGRPLGAAELAQLTGLVVVRVAALERLQRQRQLRALYDAELATLEAQRDAALDAEVYEQPSFLDELGTEAIEGGPVRVVRDAWHGFQAIVERSAELQLEAIARGDYRGAAFAAPAALIEQTFEGISDNLQMTSDAIARVLEWRSSSDAVIGTTEAALGIGLAMLDAWSLVEPVAKMRPGGPPPGGFAFAGAGAQRSVAARVVAASATIADGSLARPAIIMAVAGGELPAAASSGESSGGSSIEQAAADADAADAESTVTVGAKATSPGAEASAATPRASAGGVRVTAANGTEMIVDTNIAIALDKARRGLPLQDGERLMVEAMQEQGVLVTEKTLEELVVRSAPDQIAQQVRQLPVPATEWKAILDTLENAGVGGGLADREVVAQALLAEVTNGAAPILATADRGVINGLARLAGINPRRLGRYKNVAEWLSNTRGTQTFDVVIEGRRLTVRPVQPVGTKP